MPVENIDVLSRYGAAEEGAALDRLGGVAWQSRKARLKQRIADMADRLIKIAAERAVRQGEAMSPQEGLYDEFCARFPYAETDDQLQAIADVLEDLSSGKPMDRLICGDVGFGKTEVALRAAFVAAMSGKQVGGDRADDPAGAPASPDLRRALPRPAGEDRPAVAPGAGQGGARDQGRH